MLEKIVIRNFQKHRKLILELDPNITTLWGRTDRGKSAIIRALVWVCLNQRPDNHVHWDAEWSKVSLYVDGRVVVRKQGKSTNLYSLDGKPSKSFNKNVPAPIAKVLNVAPENFQQQHDEHFWISLPASQVSKELNRIVDLEVIDKSISDVSSEVRSAQAVIKVTQSRLAEAREKKRKTRWSKELDVKLKGIEQHQVEISALQQRTEGITLLIDQVEQYRNDVRTLKELGTKGQELLNFGDTLNQKTKRLEDLDKLISDIGKAEKFKSIEIPNIKLVDRLFELNTLISAIEEIEQWVRSKNERLTTLQKMLSKVKECPVCGSPLKTS